MKILITLLLLSTFPAYAHVFDCQEGENTQTLTLDENTAEIDGLTLINMLPVSWDLPLRVYSFINDPWFNFAIDTEMVNGKAGRADLRAHELQYGQIVVAKYYACTPRN